MKDQHSSKRKPDASTIVGPLGPDKIMTLSAKILDFENVPIIRSDSGLLRLPFFIREAQVVKSGTATRPPFEW